MGDNCCQTKRCTQCHKDKPIEEFKWHNKAKGYRLPYCAQCKREWDQRPENVEARRTRNQANVAWLKERIFAKYGRECACCGETERQFLTIDHVNGDGNKHRRELKTRSSGAFYRAILNDPHPERYQILCWNCNLAKALFGSCPHKRANLKVA